MSDNNSNKTKENLNLQLYKGPNLLAETNEHASLDLPALMDALIKMQKSVNDFLTDHIKKEETNINRIDEKISSEVYDDCDDCESVDYKGDSLHEILREVRSKKLNSNDLGDNVKQDGKRQKIE